MVNPKRRRLIYILVIFIAGTTVFFAAREYLAPHGAPKPPAAQVPKPKVDQNHPPGLEFNSLKLIGRTKGVKQWEILAESVESNEQTQMTTAVKLRKVELYRNGKLYMRGKADSGTFNMQTKDIEITGSISLESNKGDKFMTDKVIWTAGSQWLEIPGKADMVLDGRQVKADRAHADMKTEMVVAEGNVSVLESDNKMTGDRLIYSLKDQNFQLEGEAEIELNL